jgi:hypothetical protein
MLAVLCRETLRNTAFAFGSVMASEPRVAEALTSLLAERIREILPAGEFEVEARTGILNIRGIGRYAGASTMSTPPLLLALPDEMPEKLEKLFMIEGENIQEFLSRVLGQPWPQPGANLHVYVDQSTVRLWWGGPSENGALVKFRPLSRKELGL